MKKIYQIMVILAFLINPVSGATIEVSNSSALPGASNYTLINMSGMDNFGVANIDLYYDPGVVNVISASPGFSGYGGSITPNINNNIGKATFVVDVSVIPGPNSPLTLVNVSLKAVGQEGKTSALGLVVNMLADTDGIPLADLAINNGTFTVRSTTSTSTPPISNNGGGAPGGGGGSGGASGENYDNIEFTEKYDLYIYKDVLTSYKFKKLDNPIVNVNITGSTNSVEITAAVEVLRDISTLVKSHPPETIYKNINIWVGTLGYATPKNIKNAEITFRVPIIWMEANNIDPDSIEMMLYDNEWRSLPTKKRGAYNSDLLYEASTIGFSSFVITGKKAKEQIDYQSYIKNQAALNIDPREQQQEINNNSKTTSGQEGKESNYNNYLVIGAFISVIIILIMGYKIRMNRMK